MKKKQGGDWGSTLSLSSQAPQMAGRGGKNKCPAAPESRGDPLPCRGRETSETLGRYGCAPMRSSLVSLHLKSPVVRDNGHFSGNQAERGVTE